MKTLHHLFGLLIFTMLVSACVHEVPVPPTMEELTDKLFDDPSINNSTPLWSPADSIRPCEREWAWMMQDPFWSQRLLRFEILKLKKEEYKNYAILSYFSNDSIYGFHTSNPFFCIQQYGSPLVELGDGYFVTHWGYSGLIYSTWSIHIPTLVDMTWEELLEKATIGISMTWEKNEVREIREPASEVYYISYKELDEYYGVSQESLFDENNPYRETGLTTDIYIACYENLPYYADCVRVGQIYIDRIKALYEEGKLFDVAEKLDIKYYECPTYPYPY